MSAKAIAGKLRSGNRVRKANKPPALRTSCYLNAVIRPNNGSGKPVTETLDTTMPSDPNVFDAIASAIQLALTPAFLLTGIAGLLNVMAGRLSRVIDRGRTINKLEAGSAAAVDVEIAKELRTLEQRRKFTSIAITATTISALLVCLVIALLFLKGMLGTPLNEAIGVLFAVAMLAVVTGLGFFLIEMHLAMRCVRLASKETT